MVAIFGLLVLGDAAVASAKAKHNDAKKLLGDNLKQGGHYDIDPRGKYSTSVEASQGTIAAMHPNTPTSPSRNTRPTLRWHKAAPG
jgi:hypothetical protein